MAPVSSLTVGIRPLSSAVKNVSGTQVSVCHDVENLKVFHQDECDSTTECYNNNNTILKQC